MKRFENCNLWIEDGRIVSFEGHEVVYTIANKNYKGEIAMKSFDRWGNYVYLKGEIADKYFSMANEYVNNPVKFSIYERTDKRMLAVYGRQLARYSQTMPDVSMAEAAKSFADSLGGQFRFTKDVKRFAEIYLVNHPIKTKKEVPTSSTPKTEHKKPGIVLTIRGKARVIEIDGARWFVLSDIEKILGISNARSSSGMIYTYAIKKKVMIDTVSGKQSMIVVDMGTMAQIIRRSRKPISTNDRTTIINQLLENKIA